MLRCIWIGEVEKQVLQHESAVKNAEPKASHGNLKSADGTTGGGQPWLLAASDSHSILQRAQEDPLSLTNADLQRLQATAGPEVVQRLLAARRCAPGAAYRCACARISSYAPVANQA